MLQIHKEKYFILLFSLHFALPITFAFLQHRNQLMDGNHSNPVLFSYRKIWHLLLRFYQAFHLQREQSTIKAKPAEIARFEFLCRRCQPQESRGENRIRARNVRVMGKYCRIDIHDIKLYTLDNCVVKKLQGYKGG